MAYHAGHEHRAVLQVVRRRPAERLVQLRGPARGGRSGQDRDHLRRRAGDRRAGARQLRGSAPAGERVRRAAARLRRPQGRRPGDAAHADGRRAAGHDAGLRPARGDPFGGVRRVQRHRLRQPHRRLGQPGADHHGRVLPGRADDRPQGQGRRGPGRGGQGRPGRGQGAGLAAPSRPVRLADPDGRRPGLLRRRAAPAVRRAGGRAGVDAGRGAAVLDVHQRDHRPAQGLPALHRRLPGLRGRHVEVLPGHPPGRRVLVHGRHRLDHRPLLHRVRAAGPGHDHGDLRGRAELPRRRPAVADRGEARGEHLPHLAHRDPDAAQGRPGRAGQVRLPLQEHDHRRRADRARGVAVVLHRGRQGRRRPSPTPGGRPRTAGSWAAPCPPWSR